MKIQYVVALVMSAAIGLGGPARSEDTTATPPMTDAQKAALQKTVETCGTCHGVNGRSVSPTFPNLAAQSAPYIEAQLHAFKDQSRSDPDAQAYMWGMASQLNDATISALAGYFAAQPAAPGKPGNPVLIAQGKRLFEEGVPARQIPPCATCHGAHAQGMATFPRLGAVVRQLTAKDRLARSLKAINQRCKRMRHWPLRVQHQRLCRVLKGTTPTLASAATISACACCTSVYAGFGIDGCRAGRRRAMCCGSGICGCWNASLYRPPRSCIPTLLSEQSCAMKNRMRELALVRDCEGRGQRCPRLRGDIFYRAQQRNYYKQWVRDRILWVHGPPPTPSSDNRYLSGYRCYYVWPSAVIAVSESI